MVLGTMLGDASLSATEAGSVRYHSRHGWVQHGYNCRKYEVLSGFVRTPPQRRKNGGYGEWSSVWATLTSEAFSPIASLCLRDGVKSVTAEWLGRLTWEGIAWWYQDDGSLSGRTANFHTEGFSLAETASLVEWLSSLGVEAKVQVARRKSRPGWKKAFVRLTTAGTETLFARIRPYVGTEMLYKVTLPERVPVSCHWCGRAFPAKPGQSGVNPKGFKFCCGDDACRRRQKEHRDRLAFAKRSTTEAKAAYKAKIAARRADPDDPFRSRELAATKAWRLRNREKYLEIRRKQRSKKRTSSASPTPAANASST